LSTYVFSFTLPSPSQSYTLSLHDALPICLDLPPAVRIVAAANPPSSAADGWHLSPPLANRFVHLHWTHDPRVVARGLAGTWPSRSEEHTSELQSRENLVCRLLLEKKNRKA